MRNILTTDAAVAATATAMTTLIIIIIGLIVRKIKVLITRCQLLWLHNVNAK
jgi:hypothetical protein